MCNAASTNAPLASVGRMYTATVDLFRAMRADADQGPRVGRSGRTLGVRVPNDIAPHQDGTVDPGCGGMSVVPHTMWNIPSHRRPSGLRKGSTGLRDDRIYAIGERIEARGELVARPDPASPTRHAFVEPARRMSLENFELALVSTRPDWRQEWPS